MFSNRTSTVNFFHTSDDKIIQDAYQIAKENSFMKPIESMEFFYKEVSAGNAIIVGKGLRLKMSYCLTSLTKKI